MRKVVCFQLHLGILMLAAVKIYKETETNAALIHLGVDYFLIHVVERTQGEQPRVKSRDERPAGGRGQFQFHIFRHEIRL